MFRLFEQVDDLYAGAKVLRRRRYGVIEAAGGEFRRVRLRPLPRWASVPEVHLVGRAWHRYIRGDRCLLFYNQPLRFSNFLAVPYILSARDTSYRTFRRSLEALDEIARIKQSDALLCELSTWRISQAMMERWGWEPHCRFRWRSHYIKRFYGEYPDQPPWLRGQAVVCSKAVIA